MMTAERTNSLGQFDAYCRQTGASPLFMAGDAASVLQTLPSGCIDCAITSPPYWNKREYHNGGIGGETDYTQYIENLAGIVDELHRILKETGSFWLNIGDSYCGKRLLGIPWRVALRLGDGDWVLRNSIIWNKIKGGPDNSPDRLRNVHEYVFHFVKKSRGYYYNADAIRSNPRKAKVRNGAVISATGVSGVRYKRQIELSTSLDADEKKAARQALDETLAEIEMGELSDFRMIIRGQQRTTHSDSASVSGRARKLQNKGFYFLRYHRNGSKPSDVWDILPEDTQKRKKHFAAYPEDLCRIPLLATCPPGGIVLDPFCGTGTTNLVARNLDRKSVGIDISSEYLKIAEERCNSLL